MELVPYNLWEWKQWLQVGYAVSIILMWLIFLADETLDRSDPLEIIVPLCTLLAPIVVLCTVVRFSPIARNFDGKLMSRRLNRVSIPIVLTLMVSYKFFLTYL